VSDAVFRGAISRLAAGTSIVTMCDQHEHKLGLTATAVTSVSLDPPLVLVCVDNRARTAAALKAHTPFIVHFLAADQESLARRFASPIPNKFDGVSHHLTANGCPQLEDVLASVECVPYQVYPGGDHTIVIGRVIEVHVGDDDMLPLVYFRSQFLNH
jgi:flavin reductase ActVB